MKLNKVDYLHVTLIIISLILGVYLATGVFDPYEIVWVHYFQLWVITNHLTPLFEALTYAGDPFVWIIIIGVYLIAERKNPTRAFKMTMFIILISLVDLVLKYSFSRPRPFVRFPNEVQVILPETMGSYPSGHVTRLAGESYFIKNGRLSSAFLGIMIVLLSLSRVAMGVHYFTDTIGGFLVSYPLAALTDHFGIYEKILGYLHLLPKPKVAAG
ncbi:MAG: phosphatase PAP2 family protein [Conexivisphaerales archaeon]